MRVPASHFPQSPSEQKNMSLKKLGLSLKKAGDIVRKWENEKVTGHWVEGWFCFIFMFLQIEVSLCSSGCLGTH